MIKDAVFREVQYHLLFHPFDYMCYSPLPTLVFGDHKINSTEEVQKGDPLAPSFSAWPSKQL